MIFFGKDDLVFAVDEDLRNVLDRASKDGISLGAGKSERPTCECGDYVEFSPFVKQMCKMLTASQIRVQKDIKKAGSVYKGNLCVV